MAITKIKAIKNTVQKAINYITNPEKTDGQILCTGYNCEISEAAAQFRITEIMAEKQKGNYKKNGGADNKAYHMMQSFSPKDNVTAEQAHEIGKKLAEEFLEKKHEYIISTHVDKGHIHNHIIINATSFQSHKKLQTKPYKTAAQIRAISDKLCAENSLSVIKEKAKLSYSYKEWQERKSNTSWKSELRKKMNFVLERSTTIDELKKNAADIGIGIDYLTSTGGYKKNITYHLDEHKGVRGDKLADDDTYTLEGLSSRLQENKEVFSYIKEAIRNVATTSSSYDEFLRTIQKEYLVSFNLNKSGNYTIAVDNANNSQVKDVVLGLEYTPDAIKYAIEHQDFSFYKLDKQSINEEYNKSIKTKIAEKYTKITLSEKQIDKIIDGNIGKDNYSGILITVPGEQEQGQIFIDSSKINYNNQTKEYDIFVGNKFDYYFSEKKINPDISEAEQLSHRNIKGEDIIRKIELANNVMSQKINLVGSEIKGMSEKGITISLPGIDSLFIPDEYTITEKMTGSCSINIYDNWNYSYKDNAGEWKTITGAELAKVHNNANLQKNTLTSRIAYAQRKKTALETKELAQGLLLMRQEKKKNIEQFSTEVSKIKIEIASIKENINQLYAEIQTFKKAVSFLTTVQKNKNIYEEYQNKNIFFKKIFFEKNILDIKAYELAASELDKIGVNYDVNIPKAQKLIINKQEQIKDLQKQVKFKEKETIKYEKAQRSLNSVVKNRENTRDICE